MKKISMQKTETSSKRKKKQDIKKKQVQMTNNRNK